MKGRWSVGLLAIAAVMFSPAEAADEAVVVEFLEAAGLRESLELQHEASLESAQRQVAGMMEQVRLGLGDTPEEITSAFEAATQDLMKAVMASYTVDEIIEVYAGPFARNYSEAELREAIAEFSTPENQKMLGTVSEAITLMTNFIVQRQEQVLMVEVQNFMGRVDALINSEQSK